MDAGGRGAAVRHARGPGFESLYLYQLLHHSWSSKRAYGAEPPSPGTQVVRATGVTGELPRAVQHENTATGLDSGGLMRTSWDGDLHRCTAVDVLPLYGMQVLVSPGDVARA